MSNKKSFLLLIPAIIFMFAISSCTKKDEPGSQGGNDTTSVMVGDKVMLKYSPKKDDVLKYKITNSTNVKENSPNTGGKDLTNDQNITIFYSEQVNEVNESGVITYKVTFDSILVNAKISSGDTSVSQNYSSNIKDSVYSKPDFVEFNALINNPFKMRVSSRGEILEAYELENVHDAIYKAYGDTLSDKEKEVVKQTMNTTYFKDLLQNSFQKFPENAIAKDSSWVITDSDQLLIFPVKKILNYKLSDVKTENGKTLVTIDATLDNEFIEKQVKEKDLTATVEDSKTTGTGKVVLNLTRGCIVNKETNLAIDISIKMAAGGQSAKSVQTIKTGFKVELLN